MLTVSQAEIKFARASRLAASSARKGVTMACYRVSLNIGTHHNGHR